MRALSSRLRIVLFRFLRSTPIATLFVDLFFLNAILPHTVEKHVFLGGYNHTIAPSWLVLHALVFWGGIGFLLPLFAVCTFKICLWRCPDPMPSCITHARTPQYRCLHLGQFCNPNLPRKPWMPYETAPAVVPFPVPFVCSGWPVLFLERSAEQFRSPMANAGAWRLSRQMQGHRWQGLGLAVHPHRMPVSSGPL